MDMSRQIQFYVNKLAFGVANSILLSNSNDKFIYTLWQHHLSCVVKLSTAPHTLKTSQFNSTQIQIENCFMVWKDKILPFKMKFNAK